MTRNETYTDYAGDTLEVSISPSGVWFSNTILSDANSSLQAANILLSRKQVKSLRRELKLMLKEMK